MLIHGNENGLGKRVVAAVIIGAPGVIAILTRLRGRGGVALLRPNARSEARGTRTIRDVVGAGKGVS